MRNIVNSPIQKGLFGIFLLGVGAIQAFGQVVIYGNVRYPNGNPVAKIQVNVFLHGSMVTNTRTDDAGGFRMENLPKAMLTIQASPLEKTSLVVDPVQVDTNVGGLFCVNIFFRNPTGESGHKDSSSPIISTQEAAQKIPKNAQKAFSKANKYLDQQSYEKSLAAFDEAIRLFPDYFQAYSQKGVACIKMNHHLEGIPLFAKALQIFPEYGPALSGLGYCLLMAGKYPDAITYLNKSVQADSSNSKNYFYLGIANLALSRWKNAQEALEESLRLDPIANLSARIYLADALAGQKLFSQASAELHAYLETNPAAPNAQRLRQKEELYRSQIPH